MRTVAFVQARMGSSRLRNKVMLDINGTPAIEILLKRLSKSKHLDDIAVLTSKNNENRPLIEHLNKIKVAHFCGPENDVLTRYLQASKYFEADIVVRITGDCPLVDPELVDLAVQSFRGSGADYMSNSDPNTYPDGLDVEVFTSSALEKSNRPDLSVLQREHVTIALRESGLFLISNFKNDVDYSNLRLCLDEAKDLELLNEIFKYFEPNIFFSWNEVIKLSKSHPNIFSKNSHIPRNEGKNMRKGQKLWKRAKELIPGGGMLLSKRPETFLPGLWPAYFTRASGCNVWDLDDRQFIDMSLMGVGTNILGYGNQEVDEAVVKAVTDGNMSTLNCPEEVYLAERLLGMHPWADQCRFARTGGEANAIAVRIARSYTRKSNVAVCGYHGWHDWYLSSNLTEKDNLSKHLLPGLEPAGVPTQLSGTVFPFNYNNMDELLDIVDKNDIGIIKMEVVRNIQPKDNFLGKIRELANSRGIVLIFDECTSGFRESFGGLHKNYDVEPDIAIFGKALGNGYAITAVIGREDIMKEAQSTFISSTFWTERIGPSAALKCLDVMERTKSWETVTKNGEYVRTRWKNLATKHEVPIALHGIPSLTGFKIVDRDALKFKTFITQEMLKKGYLASTSLYLSTAHTKQIIDKYISDLDPIFLKIKEARQNNTIDEMLETTQCHDGFRRLN